MPKRRSRECSSSLRLAASSLGTKPTWIIDRRQFLKTTLLGTALAGIWPLLRDAYSQSTSSSAVVLVDDFAPQPLQGDQFWFYNRLGGDRGQIDGPGSGSIVWGKGKVTATITGGTNTWIGIWTSLNHLIRESIPLNFSSIFPPQILPQYQGRVIGLRIDILDGKGTFQGELQAPSGSFLWRGSVPLSGGPQNVQFNLPPLGEIRNLNWIIIGNAGKFVEVDKVGLTVEVPSLSTATQAFLWSYAMLLANFNASTGLTRDRANFAADEFDNISASGMQAAAAVMAWRLGFISKASAMDVVERTTTGVLNLPRFKGLLPHFVTNGQITPNTEWSSLDTVIAVVALIEAREALGLSTEQVEEILTSIDWDSLILPDGCISHGYDYNGNRLPNGWCPFGGESWLANLGYAAAKGSVANMDNTPPTFNGSGFIDEIAWLLVPAPGRDRWRIRWQAYRTRAVDTQLRYYKSDPCYGQLGLFGLSAAEVPDPSLVPPSAIYQAFGIGGEIPANDGTALMGHPVIVPHYAGMIASLRRAKSISMWEWLQAAGLISPLNNVESLMVTDDSCNGAVWNSMKGSWNLSLQTLGWGRLLAGGRNPLYNAMRANDLLRRAYRIMTRPA